MPRVIGNTLGRAQVRMTCVHRIMSYTRELRTLREFECVARRRNFCLDYALSFCTYLCIGDVHIWVSEPPMELARLYETLDRESVNIKNLFFFNLFIEIEF